MPMMTTLLTRSALSTQAATPSAEQRAVRQPQLADDLAGVRLRLKPCLPVEQNAQSSAQPACDETQSVPRSSSGMKTVSIALPAPTSSSHLRVPSAEVDVADDGGGAIAAAAGELVAQ